jgi:class 3 adenylate cyclase
VAVRESPEIAAVIQRVGGAWAARDFETWSHQISRTPHFRGIGTDAEEFWESSEKFLKVREVQAKELERQGWTQAEATVDRLDAFEDGSVGWALVLLTVQTPAGKVQIRATAVLALEEGAWKVIQWHTSVPSPNVETFGVELTTTLDDLLASVAQDSAAMDALARSEETVTLVFTDIVDSTVIAERVGDDGWVALVKKHEADIRRITAAHTGTVVKMLGDGSMLVFSSARAAVRAALEIRDATRDQDYAVRIGIHAGEVIRQEGDLLGVTVNKAARVASIAGADQVLVSALVAELVGSVDGITFGSPDTVSLKGLSGTHSVVAITTD